MTELDGQNSQLSNRHFIPDYFRSFSHFISQPINHLFSEGRFIIEPGANKKAGNEIIVASSVSNSTGGELFCRGVSVIRDCASFLHLTRDELTFFFSR